MTRRLGIALITGLAVACGAGSGGPMAPTPTATAVRISILNTDAIVIGNAVQLLARVTLSDGTVRDAPNAVWSSGNPAVATVSEGGRLRPLKAGQVRIFADVNPRGEILLRVLPQFDGMWAGQAELTNCRDSGALQGTCTAGILGDPLSVSVTFLQDDASVTAVFTHGASANSVATEGTVSVGGRLELADAPFLDQGLAARSLLGRHVNWRSRADTPGQTTGSFQLVLRMDGASGAAVFAYQLSDRVKGLTAAPTD